MKKYMIGLLILTSICSCQDDRLKISNIEYSVVDYTLNDDYFNKIDEGHSKALEILKEADYHFKFTDSDTLFIAPKLGMKYFGDSIFSYKVSGDLIKLFGKDGNKEILLSGKRTNEFIDIYFENDIFKRIGLLQKRVKFKNNANKLQGVYGLARMDIGSKYINNKGLGYSVFDSVGKVEFNFKKNDSLVMSSKFGMKYYGDSVFYYKIMDHKLILDSKGGRFEIPFEGKDLSRAVVLHPTDGNFNYLWITKITSGEAIPIKENEVFKIKNKGNLKLRGKYNIVGYTVGEKFRNNLKEGYSEVQRTYLPSHPPFNFINDSIVHITPSFENIFFSDTIIKYEIDGDFIRFRNEKFKREMSFMGNNKLLDLNINQSEIENIQLIPYKSNK